MAKAASPVRLQRDLMEAAASVGGRFHRSAAEQIEYWASLGRSVGSVLDPDSLLAVKAGLSRLNVEPVQAPNIDPDDVFAALEGERGAGSLAAAVIPGAADSAELASGGLRYQACLEQPGLLERIDAAGKRQRGQFSNGVFTPS